MVANIRWYPQRMITSMMNIIRVATPAVTDAVIATTKVFELERVIMGLTVAIVCEATIVFAVALINSDEEDLFTK